MSSAPRRAVVSLLLVIAAGCESPTALVVDLRTDLLPGQEFARVRTEYSTAPFAAGSTASESIDADADAGAEYLRSTQRIATFDGLGQGAAFVRVSLLDGSGAVIADRIVTAAVRQRTVIVVVVSRNCRGVMCPGEGDHPSAITCLAGRCVSPECTSALPDACGEHSCAADADCAPEVPCAVGVCIDRECFFEGDDARCEGGAVCDLDLGCAGGIAGDGGVVDAGPACDERETTCAEGVDQDCDGLEGCADPDCDTMRCDDDSACTADDACTAGTCVGTAGASCDDANPCTTDACDPVTGECAALPLANGTGCDDGSACTDGELCTDGVCGGGAGVLCDDGNPCTTESCSVELGCVSTPAAGACDDGNACTGNDQCTAGACSGTALTCDDGNVCTTDGCDPATGCTSTHNTEPCDDGFWCNEVDGCQDGACTAHPSGPRCAGSCNEAVMACVACLADADCGLPTTSWQACAFEGGDCDITGTQAGIATTPRCVSGMCTIEMTPATRACSRASQDRQLCLRAESACTYSEFCDEEAQRLVTRRWCVGTTCAASTETEVWMRDDCASRARDGMECGTSMSACAYSGPCDERQQRTVTTRRCASDRCPSSGTTTTQACATTRNSDGNSCGGRTRDRCCGGACRDIWSSEAHCGGCGQQCESGTSCRVISGGGTAGQGAECFECTGSAQCDAPGGSRNCWPRSLGGFGYCQCQDSSGCAPGQTCVEGTGSNYCRY